MSQKARRQYWANHGFPYCPLFGLIYDGWLFATLHLWQRVESGLTAPSRHRKKSIIHTDLKPENIMLTKPMVSRGMHPSAARTDNVAADETVG
eukprot:scaffold435534_cov48-Prasinocladus_malaysianus.AAC.2